LYAKLSPKRAQIESKLFEHPLGQSHRLITLTAQHPGDFFLSRFAFDVVQVCESAAAFNFFGHDKLRIGRRRHLRQVCDAKHLVLSAQLTHPRADSMRNFAAYVRVNFVKNESRNRILSGER
jgi:hypothetical protein